MVLINHCFKIIYVIFEATANNYIYKKNSLAVVFNVVECLLFTYVFQPVFSNVS